MYYSIIIITCTVICRAEDSCEAGVSAFIVAQDMLQVAQTEEVLISTLPQSLFLFNGVELNYHNIRGGIWIRGVPLFMLYHPISVANLLLVPSCRASFPWCYHRWSLGADYRDRSAIRRRRHTNCECEGRIEAHRRRTLRDDMLVPSTITFHIVVAMFETICRITVCKDPGIVLHLLTKL